MLFTGKGDDGQTGLYGASQRVSKSSKIAWALGTVDELNSLLGICRAKCAVKDPTFGLPQGRALEEVILEIQQNLFIIQAELAGAEKSIAQEKVKAMERLIREIEDKLPPIQSFTIPGATEVSAFFDYARAVARRAERAVVEAEADKKISDHSRAYLNRLSSLLFALARLAAREAGAQEANPNYK